MTTLATSVSYGYYSYHVPVVIMVTIVTKFAHVPMVAIDV